MDLTVRLHHYHDQWRIEGGFWGFWKLVNFSSNLHNFSQHAIPTWACTCREGAGQPNHRSICGQTVDADLFECRARHLQDRASTAKYPRSDLSNDVMGYEIFGERNYSLYLLVMSLLYTPQIFAHCSCFGIVLKR